jgi:DNA-directed RNA polymerase specialized sigma24 family protein
MTMGKEEECKKSRFIEAFVKDKAELAKVVATINRELHARLFERRERGITADDVVYELIRKALCHPDSWDDRTIPDFGNWVLCQFRNGRHNIVRKKNRYLSFEKESEENGFDVASDSDHVRNFENFDLANKVKRLLIKKEDNVASLVFDEILRGEENKEIALKLNLDVSDIVAAKKRIRRAGDSLS